MGCENLGLEAGFSEEFVGLLFEAEVGAGQGSLLFAGLEFCLGDLGPEAQVAVGELVGHPLEIARLAGGDLATLVLAEREF